MIRRRLPSPSRGFSLVEVMVALVVIAVGLLGIAKMQALALASTTTASMRSLAAIEAASLAASMHTNRAYWSTSAAQTTTISGSTITTDDAALTAQITAAPSCVQGGTAPCSPTQLAAYDLTEWVAALNQLLPNVTGTISCPNLTPPLSCTIQISWSEKAVAINSQEASNATTTEAFQTPTYTLYVEP